VLQLKIKLINLRPATFGDRVGDARQWRPWGDVGYASESQFTAPAPASGTIYFSAPLKSGCY